MKLFPRQILLAALILNILVAYAQKDVVLDLEISGIKTQISPRLICFSTHSYIDVSNSSKAHYYFNLNLRHDEAYILVGENGEKQGLGLTIYVQPSEDTFSVYCDVNENIEIQRVICSGSELAMEQTGFFEGLFTLVKWKAFLEKEIKNPQNDSITESRLSLQKKEMEQEKISFYCNWTLNHANSPFTAIILYYYMYNNLPIDSFVYYLQKLTDTVKANQLFATYLYPDIMQKIAKAHFKEGTVIENFTLNDTSGKPTTFAELRKNNFVLIDFWASWCGPCRKSTPLIKEVWNRYKDQNLKIISISADTEPKAWKRAIAADNMSWYHLSDLKGMGDGSFFSKYSIIAIPIYVLISPDGQVLQYADNIERMSGKIDFFFKNYKL